MDALIGWNGFVGSNLCRQREFGACFNRSTIHDAASSVYDTVVCAAAPGSMFEANRFPDRDKDRIDDLIAQLDRIRARRFVLVSSIAVLANLGGDERTSDFQTTSAYGRNRRTLEVFCASRFDNCLILRLPALFGPGLRKNFLFDILNPMPTYVSRQWLTDLSEQLSLELIAGLSRFYAWKEELGLFSIDRAALDASGRRADYDRVVFKLGMSSLQFTHRQSRFQFYDVNRLGGDIELLADHAVELAHLATEPLDAAEVFQAATGMTMPATQAKVHCEDMYTLYAPLWGREPPYISRSAEVLQGLNLFFERSLSAA